MMDTSRYKVPIWARFIRVLAFLNLAIFLAILPVAQAASSSDELGGQKPSFPDLTGKLGLWQAQTPLNIYWDDYHDTDGDSLWGNYSTLRNELTSAGHTIVEKTVPITTSELSGFDVLILLDPEYAFSSAEISDIQTWVDDGHGLFIVGEWPGAFNRDSVNELLNPYGIQFPNLNTNDGTANSFNTHPVTTGVSTLVLAGSGVLEGGTELGYSETGELVLSAYEATGKIVVWADSDPLKDGYIGSFDEITFLHNALDWLARHMPTQNALYYLDFMLLEGSTSQASEAGNAMAGSSSVGPQVTQDPVSAALENRGYNVTQVDNYPSFESAIASDSWDIVVLMNQDTSVGDIPNFLAYVAGGGRAIMTDWSHYDTLGSAFGLSYTDNDNQEPVTIIDSDLGAELPNPLSLVNPGWGTFSMGMSTTETVLATFPNGDAAVVLGNMGHTAAVGFLNDTIPNDVNAIQFYENLIDLVDGTPILRPEPTEMPPVTLRQDEDPSTQTLTLYNDGDGELMFDVRTEETTAASGISETNPIPYMEIGKGEDDPRQGPPVTQGMGGPDAFGYSWIDSDEPGGPAFDWVDISSTGTRITGLYDDNHVGPFPIGFNFDFYENAHTEFYVQSNGVINFENRYISLSNQPIPVADDYNNLIAWMWDDLYPYSDSSVYYQVVDDNKLVIQFQNYGEYSGSGRVDAQVILYRNGNIRIQYLEFRNSMDLDGSTIGIENLDGTDGLQVAFNVSYLHNELAILFTRGASWLTPEPISGTIPAGGSQEITLTYDAREQALGDYSANIIIASNDPVNPEVTVPATLHVDPPLPPEIVLSPTSIEDTLTLPDSPPSVHTLTVSNTGEGSLTYNLSLNQTSEPLTAPSERPVLTDIPDGVEYAQGELIIKIAEGADSAAVVSLRESVNATVKKTIEQLDLEVWTLPVNNEAHLLNLIWELSADSNIEYAEPNYIQKAIGIPNDTRFDELWGMHNTGQTGGTPDADIDAPEAWDTFTGSHDVVVAVIDTGMDYNHVDLVDNRWINVGEIAGNGLDDDGNGFVDDVYGYDFAYNDSNPMDGHSHGTHCSGSIGGVGNNSIGVAGVSHTVRIMAVKFLDDGGWGNTADAIESVIYAVDNGAQILSNSWGGGGFSQGLEDAISYANDHNVLFVAAAGNSGTNNDVYPHYPSSYDVPNVLAVAATDHNDAKASFSSYGLTSVDLGAPGVGTLSTEPGNNYGYKSGTSMATPHVSGAAALLKGYNPNLTALDLKSLIMDNVDPVASMNGITVTGGRLNINNALMMAGTPWITLEGELSGEIAPGGSVEVTVRLDATELSLGDYTADINVESNDPVNPHQVVPVVLHVELASGYSTVQLSSATYSTTEDGGQASITVTRTGSSDGAITIDYATSDDTATAGRDYTAISGTLNWANGDTANKTFTININDDNQVEGDETLIISLDNVTGTAILGVPDTAMLTITDNDFNCTTVTEIPLEECQALVEIYNSTNGDLWNDNTGWNVTNTPCSWYGTQCSGGHITRLYLWYNQLSGTLPAEIGNLSYLEVLNIRNNDLCGNIPVELMNLTQLWALSLDYNHLSASDPGLIDWLNNLNPGWDTTQTSCPVPSTLQLSSATYSITEDGGQASIIVTRTGGSDGAITVDYATSDDTATAGSDYTATSGTLNWGDGDTANKSFTININDDSLVEGDETVIISLDNATGGAELGTPNTAVLTITDNDDPTGFDCTTVSEIPLEECQALVEIYNSTNGDLWNDNTGWNVTNTPCSWHGIQCSGGHVTRLYLWYNQLTGTIPQEIEGLSYLEVLNIRNNSLCGMIPVELMNLTQLWALSLDYNHLSADDPGLIAWLNNINPGWDTTQTTCPNPISTLQLSSATYSITEDGGQASIIVTRTGNSDGATSVDYATSDDTATAGSDYTATSGTLNWGDGDTANKSFTININDDSLVEGDETVIVSLDNATGGAELGTPDTAVLTITDNDSPTGFDCTTVTEISLEECQALVEIYNSTNGDLWSDNTGWNVTNMPCSWHGIQCSGGHVTRLYLWYNQLTGTIPQEIEGLSYLEVLNIRNNSLCGMIPVELMNLTQLWFLSLDYNHLTASDPGLIAWLNNINPGWDTTQTPCP